MPRKVIPIAFLFIISFSCASDKQDKGGEYTNIMEMKDDKPVEIKVKPLEHTDFHYELLSNGVVSAINKADLYFQSQETVVKIYVRDGQKVHKGQKLASQDPFKTENGLLQAREALDRARLDLQDVLIGQGYSLADSLNAPAEVMKIARIRSNYDQSLYQYSLAEYNRKVSTLYAPFDGVIANLSMKEYNQPGTEPFCTLIDISHPEVIFHVLESELSLIRLNDGVLVSPFSADDQAMKGQITEINPIIDKNGMVRVKARIANREYRLYEGLNVKVKVQRLLKEMMVIPKSALVYRTNRQVVFTCKGNKAQWVYVEISRENSDSYVVTEGLTPGDSIIYEGNINLAHETPVTIIY